MLEIRLLGGFEASCRGTPLPHLGPQLRRLLALLTLESNRAVETSRLWQEIWPESDTPDIVRKSLQRLRDALGPEEARLRLESGAVCLDLHGAHVDTMEFADLVEQGTFEALEQAVKIYRGPLLRDWEEEWIKSAREDLEVGYLDALKTLATQSMQAGDYSKAAYFLRRFVNGCPEMEWGWEALIRSYLGDRNRFQALETYQAYTSFLQRENRARNLTLRHSSEIDILIREVARAEQAEMLAVIQNPPLPPPARVTAGGAIPVGSPFYIERPEEAVIYSALAQPGSTILIKGPRQIGKTSLLARALHHARLQGAVVLLTDWQNLAQADMESAETFFLTLARALADQLECEEAPDEIFLPKRAPAANFERFLRRAVLMRAGKPIVWGIDEADRVFPCSFCDDVFGKFRSWHNERALDPDGPWKQFSLLLAYSTEASLFIKNIHQSPFNVGTRISLRDLTEEQVRELNQRHGSPMPSAETGRILNLVGGHPYLVQCYLAALHQSSFTEIEARADLANSDFSDHLERMHFALLLDPELAEAVSQWLRGEGAPSLPNFTRLCAAGVMMGSSPADMRPRCSLYAKYLKRHLL